MTNHYVLLEQLDCQFAISASALEYYKLPSLRLASTLSKGGSPATYMSYKSSALKTLGASRKLQLTPKPLIRTERHKYGVFTIYRF